MRTYIQQYKDTYVVVYGHTQQYANTCRSVQENMQQYEDTHNSMRTHIGARFAGRFEGSACLSLSSDYYVCPHTTTYVSSYYYIYVLILLYMCSICGQRVFISDASIYLNICVYIYTYIIHIYIYYIDRNPSSATHVCTRSSICGTNARDVSSSSTCVYILV